MTAKQFTGLYAPDGSMYVTQTDGSGNITPTDSAYSYTNITTDATTLVKTGAGILHSITVNTLAATGTATIYDNVTATAPIIGKLTTASTGTFVYDVAFSTGLTIVTATAAPDLTVTWK